MAQKKSDEVLVEEFISGRTEVFEILFERHYKKVYNLCLRFCNMDSNLAEETAQETFLQVYTSLPRFQFKSSFYTWLYRVTFNTCSIAIKKQARLRTNNVEDMEQVGEYEPGQNNGNQPTDFLLRKEYSHYVNRAINDLPRDQKEVMLLGPVLGHSYQEISDIIGESVTVIKGRLFRARQNFKKKFEKIFELDNFVESPDTK